MFKALPIRLRSPGRAEARQGAVGYANGSTAAHAAADDPHAIGADGWLTAYDVKKSYRKRMVVKGVNLAVGRGESVGLLGPNGAGKTTVFYMITGLVAADQGRITIDGEDVTKLPMYQRARLGVGYLPQEASIFRGLTVEQNIRAVLEVVEPSRKKREQQLDSLLDEFNITRLRKSPSIALSGGERRRVEIATMTSTDSTRIDSAARRSPASQRSRRRSRVGLAGAFEDASAVSVIARSLDRSPRIADRRSGSPRSPPPPW